MCQIVQQALMPAVHVGYLQHVLVTVIPDYKEKLEDAWKAVIERQQLLVTLAKDLHGLFGFFIALETHGAAADKKKKRKNPNPEDAAHQADQQGADADANAPAKKVSVGVPLPPSPSALGYARWQAAFSHIIVLSEVRHGGLEPLALQEPCYGASWQFGCERSSSA